MDELAAELHQWQRTLDAHPGAQPVTLNVWEAVYFDHDLAKLTGLAELAARVGVERFVLDDGWFGGRRHDHAGSGDWWVSAEVWPDGLTPLIDRVHELGMQFGLWFEPEMVNPDSDLYREHPDWILQSGGRVPILQRNQLVLDLSRDEVRTYLRDRISRYSPSTRSTTSSGITTAICSKPAAMRVAARRPSTRRRSGTTACSTSCASCIRTSRGNRARPAADGSTWVCSSTCSGSGPLT